MSKRKTSSAVPTTKPNEATLHDKISIIKWHHANGKSQAQTVQHFKANGFPALTAPTFSKWLKKEEGLLEKQQLGVDPSVKRFRGQSFLRAGNMKRVINSLKLFLKCKKPSSMITFHAHLFSVALLHSLSQCNRPT